MNCEVCERGRDIGSRILDKYYITLPQQKKTIFSKKSLRYPFFRFCRRVTDFLRFTESNPVLILQ